MHLPLLHVSYVHSVIQPRKNYDSKDAVEDHDHPQVKFIQTVNESMAEFFERVHREIMRQKYMKREAAISAAEVKTAISAAVQQIKGLRDSGGRAITKKGPDKVTYEHWFNVRIGD